MTLRYGYNIKYIGGVIMINITKSKIKFKKIILRGKFFLHNLINCCIIRVQELKKGVLVMRKITVFDVAAYVLNKLSGKEITTMKLQKLVYYCQAWSLAWDDVPLFDEDFEAWANGPVCRELFEKHKGKFLANIDMFSDADISIFNDTQRETMDIVIRDLGDKSPHWLSELTHSERPWQEARRGYAPGESCSVIISKEVMQEYYGGLS